MFLRMTEVRRQRWMPNVFILFLYENYWFLEVKVVQTGRSLWTFRRNLLPLFSRWKSKPSMEKDGRRALSELTGARRGAEIAMLRVTAVSPPPPISEIYCSLKAPSNACRMTGWLPNNELERMWEETVMAYFKVLSRNFLGETKENHAHTDCKTESLPPEITC
jgi:hypothetical protein